MAEKNSAQQTNRQTLRK